MRHFFSVLSGLALALSLVLPTASAAESELHEISSPTELRGLEGVGRIDIRSSSTRAGFCTGALVSPTLVLTAAHCVFDPSTGEAQATGSMTFRAGLINGREEARRNIRRMVIHPDYEYSSKPRIGRVATDLALLELDRSLSMATVRPFPVSGRLDRGDPVLVVSYAHDRAAAPSRQDGCKVLDRNAQVLVLDCDVDFGASGSPVFVQGRNGWHIVSVISSKGEFRDAPAAFAVTVEEGIEELKHELSRVPRLTSARKTIRVGETNGSIIFQRPDR